MGFTIKTQPYRSIEHQYHAFLDERILGSSYKSQKEADKDAKRETLKALAVARDYEEHGYTLRVLGTNEGVVLVLRRVTGSWHIDVTGPGRKRHSGYGVSAGASLEQASEEQRKYAENFGGIAWETT